MKGFLLAILIVLSSVASVFAVTPDEVLPDAALETRARALSLQLRCMVCQNQSIDDSDADLAKDLRVLVRERLTSGDSDEEVLDFVVARYGEFVLLKPRFNSRTILLWGAPILVLLLGTVVLCRNRKSVDKRASTGLSDDEEKRLDVILKQD